MLDLAQDVRTLTAAVVDIESVSGGEDVLAGLVEQALAGQPHLKVDRSGNTVVARTNLGRGERVVIAGHLDTVPVAGNLPSRVEGGLLYGCGTSDMKAGVAVALKLAATVPDPVRDVTYVFYDCEEIEAARNGLTRVAREHPDWLAADFAVLMEPTDGVIEGGCQGTLRADIRVTGKRAHSARSWFGVNAIHGIEPVLARLNAYEARRPVVDGLKYHEGLNAVGVRGGVAGNVIPDECVVTVNYRFAPDLTIEQAQAHVREVFDGYEVTGRRLHRRRGRRPQGQAGLDGRGAVLGARRPGRELRPRRPEPGAPEGRVRDAGEDRGKRAGDAHLAHRGLRTVKVALLAGHMTGRATFSPEQHPRRLDAGVAKSGSPVPGKFFKILPGGLREHVPAAWTGIATDETIETTVEG
jgi:succinyl-diaminopimelate desuccinylase